MATCSWINPLIPRIGAVGENSAPGLAERHVVDDVDEQERRAGCRYADRTGPAARSGRANLSVRSSHHTHSGALAASAFGFPAARRLRCAGAGGGADELFFFLRMRRVSCAL